MYLGKVADMITIELQTAGGVRDPSKEELALSPHQSFTQVIQLSYLSFRCCGALQYQQIRNAKFMLHMFGIEHQDIN